MNHPFSPSAINSLLCNQCEREAIDHTDRATCEVCGASGEMNLTSTKILMCLECDYKDMRVRTTDELEDRAIRVKHKFAEVDSQIRISTDIFNAKTVAIHELKKIIDATPSIPADKKYFELASLLSQRYDKLIDIIFGARDEILHAESEQRAIQTYYNELGKKLRADEREKIRLKDATYKPIEKVDVKKTPRAPSIKKVDGNEIRAACARHEIPQAIPIITMLMVAKKIGVEEAIKTFKETMLAKK